MVHIKSNQSCREAVKHQINDLFSCLIIQSLFMHHISFDTFCLAADSLRVVLQSAQNLELLFSHPLFGLNVTYVSILTSEISNKCNHIDIFYDLQNVSLPRNILTGNRI